MRQALRRRRAARRPPEANSATAPGAGTTLIWAPSTMRLAMTLEAGRDGVDDALIDAQVRACIDAKLPGHGINDPGFLQPDRGMNAIGG